MSRFPILLQEGAFHMQDRTLSVSGTEGTVSVASLLQPFERQRVRIAVHHLPTVMNPRQWGGGSCLWENSLQDCPAGHRLNPTWLYNVSAEGILYPSGGGTWEIEMVDGERTNLDLRTYMPGHTGRIACALLLQVEEMRDKVGASMPTGVSVQVEELANLLTHLKPRGV